MDIKTLLSEKNMRFSIRPHPTSFTKKEVSRLELETIGYKIDDNDEIDFYNFNVLISDWSGIFIEFSYFQKNCKEFLFFHHLSISVLFEILKFYL